MTDGPQTGPIPRDWEAQFSAGHWDFLSNIEEAPRNALVAGFVQRLASGGLILDVGCGEGVLLDYLDQTRLRYVGFDMSATAIDRAEKRMRVAGHRACVASMETFRPDGDEPFDLVVFNESISHALDPIATLYRYFGFVRTNGWLLISQFQTFGPDSDGARFVPLLQAELDSGRLTAAHVSEVTNCKTGIRWRLYSFQREPATTSG